MSGLFSSFQSWERGGRISSVGTYPVSRLVFELTDKNAFDQAIEHCAHWLAPKTRVGIPPAAERGAPFDLSDQYGANPCRAVRIDAQDGRVWSARLDEADNEGRTWIAELYVEHLFGQMARFGAQLICVNRGTEPFSVSRPSVVRDILSELSAETDGWVLTESAQEIHNAGSLISLLYDENRRLPVVVGAPHSEDGVTAVDMGHLAGKISGAAHIVTINPNISWDLTHALGKQMSCFEGATRIYMPGLTEETEDPYQHPLWLADHGSPRPALVFSIASRILPLGFVARTAKSAFPRFAEVRDAAARLAVAKRGGLSDGQKLTQEVETLKAELAAAREERATWESLAAEEQDRRLAAEAAQQRLESENLRLASKAEALGGRFAVQRSDVRIVAPSRRLASYDDLEDWAEEVLGEAVRIHPQALKDCRKNGHMNMLERTARALIVIRDFVVPALREGGLARQELARTKLAELGMEDTNCFADRDAAKHHAEYSVMYEGQRQVLYDHIKYGNGYDNANQIRIYYFWDAARKSLVVGKMPSHLRNKLTN